MARPVFGGAYKYEIMQNAAAATADGTVLYANDAESGAYAVVAFQVTGTWTGTISFEATVDGSNWVALEVESVGNSATLATSTTANGIFRAVVLGLSQVRARLTWTSGTSVTVVGQLVA